ncbi:hypothetical protein ACTXPD_04545 [Vreelandella alkaliphila]|uniref:hypothetical protein n=1 Tax=Vreelandella alkaliphila TaxID=272774 RepID=UPI003FD8D3A9
MNWDDSGHVEQLRSWCQQHDYRILPFDEVDEKTAAAMCDRSPETLRYWRGTDRRLLCRKTRAGWRYSLADLAEFLTDDAEG